LCADLVDHDANHVPDGNIKLVSLQETCAGHQEQTMPCVFAFVTLIVCFYVFMNADLALCPHRYALNLWDEEVYLN
jgi:hypothetical protein